jgi:hypothetical protein
MNDLPIPNTAILTDGSAARLDKNDQIWLKNDRDWKERNRKYLDDNPEIWSSDLKARAFVEEEVARLREKRWKMESLGISAVEYRANPPRGLSFGMKRLIQLSWNEAEKAASGLQWATYKALWEWSGSHFSSDKQDKFWDEHGKKAFYKRINKVRKACGFSPVWEA